MALEVCLKLGYALTITVTYLRCPRIPLGLEGTLPPRILGQLLAPMGPGQAQVKFRLGDQLLAQK